VPTTVAFFNANNFFLRYKWGQGYPGDASGKSYYSSPKWGFLPLYTAGTFVPYNETQTRLLASSLGMEDGTLPDVALFCEVESLLALRAFNENYLGGHYREALLIDSRDFRQIDVGVLSNRPILSAKSHVDDRDEKGGLVFSRDCLEVELDLEDGYRLVVFVNHLKSKFVDRKNKTAAQIKAATRKSNERRKSQAEAVKRIVKSRFAGSAFNSELFMVVGDLNDQPYSPWVKPLVRDAGLYDVMRELPEEERWTYWWKSKNRVSQIDYLLLSPALKRLIQDFGVVPRIERRGIGFKSVLSDGQPGPRKTNFYVTEDDSDPAKIDFRFERFDGVTQRSHASDHCPVFLEIP